ncbi:MAG: hypothetical protein IJ816_04970 [Alloprevotella sp.]|nr:hypothetical protein [Alloprevotella sp.]
MTNEECFLSLLAVVPPTDGTGCLCEYGIGVFRPDVNRTHYGGAVGVLGVVRFCRGLFCENGGQGA